MKKPALISIFTVITLLLSYSAVAAASTPTPADTLVPAKNDTENIQELIKKKAAENQVKGVTTDGQVKRGFIGTVKRVSEEALTVDTRKGTEIITLSTEVAIIQDGKASTVNIIEIGSQVAIMGYQNGEDFTPKRILVMKKPLQTNQKSVWIGSIKKMEKIVSGNLVAFTIQTRSGEEKTFTLSGKPVIEDNKGVTMKSTDLETDQDVLIITIPEEPTAQVAKDSSGKIVRVHSLVASDAPTVDKTTPTPTPKAAAAKKATATPTE
ncbi:MAG: hypothetical protein ABI425_04630 [Patescibacteria group bacterium]